ncbi:uncharacterized protein EMH_0041480 [Eimeria mitis]|uniref:Uncharacterized protein n=1 Tax=Eimeria mitis TaxID=44415 RepID=U6JSS5_9EIME|nr:uncharacterized protein EMH_0041480 [Eimeria mitis]CDJ28510.1 hypothetical protein, conserved [Eimeria mitis]
MNVRTDVVVDVALHRRCARRLLWPVYTDRWFAERRRIAAYASTKLVVFGIGRLQAEEQAYASTTLVVFGIGRFHAEELGRCQNGVHQLWKWAFAHGTANRAHSARECGVSQKVRAAALWPVYALPWLRYVSILEQR